MTLRATIVRIFHVDMVLARQLFRYATEIGVYPLIRVSYYLYFPSNNFHKHINGFYVFLGLSKCSYMPDN